jgi:general secretion pathway protein D
MRSRVSIFAVVALLFLALAGARGALAEGAASLVEIRLIAEGTNQTIFEFAFADKIADYATPGGDARAPAISFTNTSRAQGAVTPRGLNGFVRNIDFDQTGSALVVRFAATMPAKVTTSSGGTRKLLVTVSHLTGREAANGGSGAPPTGSADEPTHTPGGPLPRASDPLPGADGYELVMLKYADVSEIVGLLTEGITVKSNNVFIRREPGFGSPGTGGTTYTANQAQAVNDDKPLGQSVDSSLAIDRRLNAIWIKGSPDRIARLKAQIALIDVPVDSVILETQFVELTEAGARNIGIDFNNANGQMAVGTVQAGQFIPFGFGTNRLDSAALQAALYAQVQEGEGRIVSKPRIVAQSGSTAKIITGDALPILTAITLSGVNGVSQQVQYVNVGVTLQIAPRISPDGFVTSQIYGVVSSVTGFSQGYPTISQREAETSASVRDGETFVIGGLTQDNEIKSEFKVPLLGDIPLLGELFSLEKSTRTNTELYIVITPHIVRHRRFEVSEAPAVASPPQAEALTILDEEAARQ